MSNQNMTNNSEVGKPYALYSYLCILMCLPFYLIGSNTLSIPIISLGFLPLIPSTYFAIKNIGQAKEILIKTTVSSAPKPQKRVMSDEEKMQNAMGMQHEQMRNQEPLFKSGSSSSSSSSSIFDRDSKW